jgi:hypothetical protein
VQLQLQLQLQLLTSSGLVVLGTSPAAGVAPPA